MTPSLPALTDNKALRLGILRGLSGFFARQEQPDGGLPCPRHKVEHTGKLVYAALIDLAHGVYTREDEPLERARRRVLRTVDHLGIDPGSDVPVFLPGRVDGRNASNNAIDGGACADVIATLLEEAPELFDERERARCVDALERHIDGYLRHAARERPITAQRLWAATGVARAARLLGRDDWRADALAGCASALADLTPDGVAPYIPEGAPDCTHPGLADTSTFYHSRTPGFLLYVHEVLGEALSDHARERIHASLDALLAMRDGNGHKVLHNEAKAWYWESDYEVASHPFDVYALHVGARVLGEPAFALEAGRAMEEWIAHINPLDGGADSHHGRGVNFQCRIFWSGHAAWIARVIHDVMVRAPVREPRDVDLAHSGLLHVERPRYTALLRSASRGGNHLFGCDAAGGSLQSLVVRPPGLPRGEERVPRVRFIRKRAGSWRVTPSSGPGRLARWRELLAADKQDLRFRLYITTVEWKAGRWIGAPLYGLRNLVARPWRDASPEHASHLDHRARHEYVDGVATVQGGVADALGRRLDGVRTERRYGFEDDAVRLEDTLHVDAGVRGSVRYTLPEHLVDVTCRRGADPLRVSARELVVRLDGSACTLTVSGHWRTDDATPPPQHMRVTARTDARSPDVRG